MKLQEAIERASKADFLFWKSEHKEDLVALKLLIEAGKWRMEAEQKLGYLELLPGETAK